MDRLSEVTLLKLGGSLLTEKTAVDAIRPAVLARLAAEIAEVAHTDSWAPAAGTPPAAGAPRRAGLVLAHGSGSFGHVAARRHGIAGGLRDASQLPGVSLTQERAAALHWQVCAALAAAGLHPFSLAPSSSVGAAAGRPPGIALEPAPRAGPRASTPPPPPGGPGGWRPRPARRPPPRTGCGSPWRTACSRCSWR